MHSRTHESKPLSRALFPIIFALLFAVLTCFSFRASMMDGQPWNWHSPGVGESTVGLPDSFLRGQRSLLWLYGTLFSVAAGISSWVASGFVTRSAGTFSFPGRTAFSCPALILPLVGWFGPFSFSLFGVVAALPVLVVLIQAARHRTTGADLASIPFNLLLLILIFHFCGYWFSVYGD